MNFTALEQRIATLEHSIDSLELWLAFATFLVVFGLVLEYWYEVIRLIRERPFHWRAFQEILGAVFVTVGVAGELVLQFRASSLETDLRTANHKVETQLRTAAANSLEQAGSANKAAAEANERARQFESNIADAKRDAATARREAESFRLAIATANERAARNEKEAAALRKAAEDERLARVKIEERLADRRINEALIAQVAIRVKRFSGQEFQVTSYWDLKEPMAIANGIYQALLKADWAYIKPTGGSALLGGVAGVLVYVHPQAVTRTREAVQALVSALNDVGLLSELKEANDPNPNNKIYVNVGTKP